MNPFKIVEQNRELRHCPEIFPGPAYFSFPVFWIARTSQKFANWQLRKVSSHENSNGTIEYRLYFRRRVWAPIAWLQARGYFVD